jgi:hypothetical protein
VTGFFKSRNEVAPTPKPECTVEEGHRLRKQELRAKLNELDCAQEQLRQRVSEFRSRNMALINDRLVFVSADLNGRAELERQWRQLITEADTVVRERNSTLAAWSQCP